MIRSARRRSLLAGAARIAVLLIVAGAPQARAQDATRGFQGIVTGGAGSTTVTTGPSRTTIVVNTPTARIDWLPMDANGTGVIDFLPAGYRAKIYGPADFTLLNRILPDSGRPIALNGTVVSRLTGGGTPVAGGNVWFYSPGGIVLGPNAAFDVGGLLLSTNDIALDGAGLPDPQNVRFVGATDSISPVSISAGARVTATDYVAILALRIVQSGRVRADGQIAFVAAERGTLTMPVGGDLFSIAVDVDGGTAATGRAIRHDGVTGGPASTATSDPHAIYMVTVAKNDAVTMLLGGTIGYDSASSASAVGERIVLSAGRSVTGGAIDANSAPIGAPTGIRFVDTRLTSDTIANASGNIALIADSAGSIRAREGFAIRAGGAIAVNATGANGVVAGGAMSLDGGAIAIGHQANNATDRTLRAASISLVSAGEIDATAGSSLHARQTLSFDAATSAAFAVLSAGDAITGRSGGSMTIGDARAAAPAQLTADGGIATVGSIDLTAGAATSPGGYAAADLLIRGRVSAKGAVSLVAGRDVILANGASARAGNLVSVSAGDDIIVAPGADLAAGFAPLAGLAPDLAGARLTAGGLPLAYDPAAGNVASVILQGGLRANATAIAISGGAMQAVGARISGRSLAVDIVGAPRPVGALSDDGGQLVAECREGAACLGRVGLTEGLTVGSDAAAVPRTINTDALRADNAVLRAAGDITLGRSAITGAGATSIVSSGGAVAFRGGTIAVGSLAIHAAGDITGGRLSIAADRIGLTSGGDLRLRDVHAVSRVAGADDTGRIGGSATAGGVATIFGTLAVDAGDLSLTSAARLGVRSASAAGRIALTSTSGPLILGAADGGDALALRSGRSMVLSGPARAGTLIALDSGRAATIAAATSGSGGFALRATGKADLTGPVVSTGTIRVAAASVRGGVIDGGAVSIAATKGRGSIPDISLGAVTARQGDVVIVARHDVSLAGPLTAAGDVRLSGGRIVAGDIAAGANIRIDSGRTVTLAAATATNGGIAITSFGETTVDTLTARQKVSVESGAIRAAGRIDAGSVSLTATRAGVADGSLAAGPITARAGAVQIRATGDADLTGAVTATGAIEVTASGVVASGPLDGAGVSLTATSGGIDAGAITARSGDVAITAPQGVSLAGPVQAAGAMMVEAGDAALVAAVTATGAIDITADGIVTSGPLDSAGVSLTATSGGVKAGAITARSGDVTIAAPQRVSLVGPVRASGAVGISGGATTLSGPIAATGALEVSAGSIAATGTLAGGTVSLTATSGGIDAVAITARYGTVAITAPQRVSLAGAIRAATDIAVTAGDLAISRTLDATTIGLTSSTIAIAPTARIGAAGETQWVSFISTDPGRAFLGASGSGYSLSLDRVQANDVLVALPGDLTIGDLSLVSGTTIGGDGGLSVTAGGSVLVTGAVRLTGASAANRLAIRAGQAIDVVAPQGSIAILDSALAPAGILSLSAGRISVAMPGALADVLDASGLETRDARLAINDGAVNDAGLLIAGALNFDVGSGLYIQNTGNSDAFSDRRGFTAGAGGVSITQRSSSPTGQGSIEIVINGVQTSGGVTTTGLDLIRLLTLPGAADRGSRVDTLSTANGCRIFAVRNCTIGDKINIPDPPNPHDLFPSIGFSLIDFALRSVLPIDDPFTSTGNEDQWDDSQ